MTPSDEVRDATSALPRGVAGLTPFVNREFELGQKGNLWMVIEQETEEGSPRPLCPDEENGPQVHIHLHRNVPRLKQTCKERWALHLTPSIPYVTRARWL